MPSFSYQAFDPVSGKHKKGILEADSKASAFSALINSGLTPLSIQAAAGESSKTSLKNLFPGFVRKIHLAEPLYYLGTMLETGSPLSKSLELLGRMSGERSRKVWLHVKDKVEAGASFSEALAEYPRVFPSVYQSMVRVAEQTGHLGQILKNISAYEERRGEFSGSIITAMAYPAVIFLVGMGAVYFLLTAVLPKIANIFASTGTELPPSTRFLLGLSSFLSQWGLGLILVLAGLALLFAWVWKKNRALRLKVHKYLWFSSLVRKSNISRFSGLLGFQLRAGIPMVQALQGVSQAVPSVYLQNELQGICQEVATGKSLDRVLEQSGLFSEVFVLTVASGRKTGQLPDFLEKFSGLMERDLNSTLKRFNALLEPLLILGVGLIIGFIVIGVMGPIFDLSTLVK
jgi:general secretion pathway protein F/type IV pilus assembly protein PilC